MKTGVDKRELVHELGEDSGVRKSSNTCHHISLTVLEFLRSTCAPCRASIIAVCILTPAWTLVYFFCPRTTQPRQHTARVMSETIDELESEFDEEGEDYFDSTMAANKFRELMSALDVEESTQELAVAILKEEGLQAVQVCS